MRELFKIFAKRLFGGDCGKLVRTLITDAVVFLGLRASGIRVEISPAVLYLMVSTVSGLAMWRALTSRENAADMQNLLMQPTIRRRLVPPYMAASAAYVFVTQTAIVLAVVFAVSDRRPAELAGCLFLVVHAYFAAAGIFLIRRLWPVCVLWAIFAAAFLFLPNVLRFLLCFTDLAAILVLLFRADGYSLCVEERGRRQRGKSGMHCLVWQYLFRYMAAHTGYLANTAALWGLACALPFVFRQLEGPLVYPIGFAILSMNTPVCTLLSCNPELETAVRFMPKAKKLFCAPYCLYIFAGNLIAGFLFLLSMQLLNGNITPAVAALAVFFSLLDAVCAVLLEWYFPIRGWKIESDVWRNPRKYIVPCAMLLLAGAVLI